MSGFLLRRTRDPHLAEDLAQETFVKATRALLGWRGENPAAWLLTIARNVLIDHVRRARRELALPVPEELGVPPLHVASLDVRDALERLPERHRRLLVLVYFEGFSRAAHHVGHGHVGPRGARRGEGRVRRRAGQLPGVGRAAARPRRREPAPVRPVPRSPAHGRARRPRLRVRGRSRRDREAAPDPRGPARAHRPARRRRLRPRPPLEACSLSSGSLC
ncbi:RNA polymerase sigma factor [Nonomuraea aridisoli]|uniref:RNA polymerase sigma factor n=1 Tax=Nonomuraea aridisoli TaxID=2070368 RepID=UPI0015E8C585